VKKFSEREKEAFRHKLSYLSKTVAPPSLPNQMRLAVFLQLGTLLSQLPPAFWPHFELLAHLAHSLKEKTQGRHINHNMVIKTYSHLKVKGLLTDNPYAAAICVSTSALERDDECEKYARYRALIILSCLQLHILGNNESAIENALREIRLIANNRKHLPLLALLPEISSQSLPVELIPALDQKRRQNKSLLELLQRGLGFLSVAIYNACRMAKGTIRHREVEYFPSREEDLMLMRQEPTDDTDLVVSELSISRTYAKPELDESDEPLDVRPGRVISIKEPSNPHKSFALRAIQSKRLAEQLSVRQQSLPCSFEQASEWDIQHLVAKAVTLLSGHTKQADSAALLLLSLISGRSPENLFHDVNKNIFRELKNHPCLYLTHSVPASKQEADCDSILPSVSGHLILPLPIVLKGQKLTSWSLDIDKLKAILSDINARHETRLTLGRIARYLEHWYVNQGLDRAEIALIRGEPRKSRPALSYSNLDADPIIEHHCNYIEALFRLANLNPGLPTRHPTANRLGSRLNLPMHVLHNLFCLLAPTSATAVSAKRDDAIAYHNNYVCYVWALLAFATGHRDVTAPMGQLGDYNSHNRTWWISDKEIRHGLAARTVVVPVTAARQVELYLEHLRALAKHTRFVAPMISERCEMALAGSSNLLFAIITPLDKEATPANLCPSMLDRLLGKKMPWARNWPRHYLRSELKRQGVAPEQIDGWMGHEEIGEEAFGRHSTLSLHHLNEIANRIEQILKNHKIEALPGWQTR